ncbi:GrpB family protein [Actinomycetes bacterium KLBMP 9797]
MLKVGLAGETDTAASGLARLLAELGATVTGPSPVPTRADVEGRDAIVVERLPPAPPASAAHRFHLVLLAGGEGAAARSGFPADAADVCVDGADGDEVRRSVAALWCDRLVPFEANLRGGRRAARRRRPVLFDPDPTWPGQARRLIGRLTTAAGERVVRVDHIGSTSVPGLPAKDLVDIQVVVADLDVAVQVAEDLRIAGFVRAGRWTGLDRCGAEHAEEVVVDADPGRPVNINIRPVTSPVWRDTLLFRDWLRVDAAARGEYAALKRNLAARPDAHVDDYSRGKMPWISAALTRAEHDGATG